MSTTATILHRTVAALGLLAAVGVGSAQAQEFQSAASAMRPAPASSGSTAPTGAGYAGTQEFQFAAAASRAPALTGSTVGLGVAYAGTQEFQSAAAATRPGSAASAFDQAPDTRYAQMSRVPSRPAPSARLMASAPAGIGPNG